MLDGGGGVDLEITESLLMTDVDESIRKLRALRGTGMRIALDDFGTGYSSLAYLSRLPIDTLKIDRAFVKGMTDSADDTSIVSTIISLAQALRLQRGRRRRRDRAAGAAAAAPALRPGAGVPVQPAAAGREDRGAAVGAGRH